MSDQPSSNLQKYGTYTPEAAAEEGKAVADLVKSSWMKWVVGRNVVRILPPPVGRSTPFYLVMTHYIDIPGSQKKVVFNCPKAMAKRPCPVCNKADALLSTGNPVDVERAKEYRASFSALFEVIDRQAPEKGPLKARVTAKQHERLRFMREDPDAGSDYCDPVNGYDIVVKRTGTGPTDTRYEILRAGKPSALGNDEWLEMRQSFAQDVYVPTVQEIREKFNMARAGEDPAPSSHPLPAHTPAAAPAPQVQRPAAAASPIDAEFVDTGDDLPF